MLRTALTALVTVGCLGWLSTTLRADEPAAKPAATTQPSGKQLTCPFSGKKINPKIFVDHKGYRIYFCCPKCQRRFKADPDKHLPAAVLHLISQGAAVQVRCPMTGRPINRQVFLKHQGQKIYFCCPGCKKRFQADPDKYLAKLAQSCTSQVRCPVMGGPIDPTVHTSYKGKDVYFCCQACVKKFRANPKKHAPRLQTPQPSGSKQPAPAAQQPKCQQPQQGKPGG